MLNKKALAASVSAAPKVYVEDVFSTYLYTGNGSSQTITNGIDLSGKGGLVWEKPRNTTVDHFLIDSARGSGNSLASNTTGAQASGTTATFNSDGYTYSTSWASDTIVASWTFRKQAKFFDVVTYTGNGTNRTISHNLGSTPGCIMVKRTDAASNWRVYHRGISSAEQKGLILNLTNATTTDSTFWNNTAPTSTNFSVGTDSTVNGNGLSYVAYLFAHDAGGFGDAGDQSVISCGSYTGTGDENAPPVIDLGWEPQWLLIKRSDSSGNWNLMDNMRGLIVGTNDAFLLANASDAEVGSTNRINPSATGFFPAVAFGDWNGNGGTYIYIAIRRGPMKTPTDATKVFTPTVYTGTNVDNRLIDTTIAPDMVMIRQRNDTVVPGMYTGARLTGQEFLITGSTVAGATDADSFDAQIVSTTEYGNAFSSMSGVWVGNDATRKFNANTTSNNHVIHAFKRAPGFFDVVCYTGTGANRTVSHNLGVAPELLIVKNRAASAFAGWYVYAAPLGNTKYLRLQATDAEATFNLWQNTTPTSSVFSLSTSESVNDNTINYIAFLFASVSGVSKVGTYTGNGSNQTINCGFTAGARYVLIKRTDNTGDWFVYDSARGIVSGNDPQLKLNATTAEATGFDAIDPDNSGFIVNNDATNFPINVNNATYIFWAVA